MGDTAGTKAFAGPVVVDPDHSEYCGAYQKTNNTAELSALLMAMNYIHNNFEAPGKIYILYDSTWAANVARRIWRPKVNKAIAGRLQRAVDKVLEEGHQLEWHHVKAHKGHVLNELADAAADKGSRLTAPRRVRVALPQRRPSRRSPPVAA